MTSSGVCVLLCRDCCCGTERKHPEVDHAAQERELREAAADGGGRVIRTRCLGVCEHSNVVVIKTAERTHWFGGALTPEQTRLLTEFVRSAGETPEALALEFKSVARGVIACRRSS